jgi:excisionase family DNA binding protein
MQYDYDILTPDEVMDYLNIGRNAVYTLLNSGKLNSFKVGKKWKIPRKELDAYVDRSVRNREFG